MGLARSRAIATAKAAITGEWSPARRMQAPRHERIGPRCSGSIDHVVVIILLALPVAHEQVSADIPLRREPALHLADAAPVVERGIPHRLPARDRVHVLGFGNHAAPVIRW